MSTPLYNHYDELNKDTLIQDEDFLQEASDFLIEREGYDPEDVVEPEDIYDGFMEHFRYQNVNEVTATRDLFYVQEADQEGKERFGRLMDTYDKMDSDLGADAAIDYLGGVFTAPSTYAGIFTGGAAKVGTIAAQQGTKLAIREIIKRGAAGSALRSGTLRGAATAAAIDVPFAAGTVLAQEKSRVESGLQEEVDMSNVALSAALSTVASGTLGGVAGAKKTLTSNTAENIRITALNKEKVQIDSAHRSYTKAVLKDTKKSNFEEGSTVAKDAKKFADTIKMSLEETVPDQLKEGAKLKKKLDAIETKQIENIAAAAARVVNKVPPIKKVGKKGQIREERMSSRIARGLKENVISEKEVADILSQHNVTMQQLSSLFADRLSSIGAEFGAVGRVTKAEKKKLLEELTEIDQRLVGLGSMTEGARLKLKNNPVKGQGSKVSNIYNNWFSLKTLNKARIGFMTTQLATTARNTTNGYMRNYVYALDNVGMGLANLGYGSIKSLAGVTSKEASQEGAAAVSRGIAQMKSGFQAAYMKDLWMGTTSYETAALDLLFRDPRFSKSNLAKELFREMGDVGDLTGQEGGILWLARKANYLNTLSDNMFKRAIFAREMDKYLTMSGQKGGLKGFFDENYLDPKAAKKSIGKFSQINDDAIGEAMETALAFTYQTGKFQGKSGTFNKAADAFINIASDSVLVSQAVPFPRYLVNQFIFMYEHMPILGLFDFGGILRKQGDVSSGYAERFGKQFGGLATLGAFFAMRNHFGDETTGPYQYYDPTGGADLSDRSQSRTFDVTANLGPFMGFAMLADLLYRHTGPNRNPLFGVVELPQLHDNDKVAVDVPYNVREIAQAFTGGQGRAGVGLDIMDGITDLAINYNEGNIAEETFKQNSAKLIGNFFNTYTVGGGMLKDLAGSFLDADYRIVQDNSDIDMMEYMFKQAARSIPQAYDPEEGDRYLAQPTRSDPVKNVNPFLKLLTGFTEEEERTEMEKELDRLRFDYVELSPRKIAMDAPLTNEARARMGAYMEREIFSFIQSPDYKNLAGDRLKKKMLKEKINEKRTDARKEILGGQIESQSPEKRLRGFKAKYNGMSSSKRGVIADIYKDQTNGRNLFDDLKQQPLLYEWIVSTERDIYSAE